MIFTKRSLLQVLLTLTAATAFQPNRVAFVGSSTRTQQSSKTALDATAGHLMCRPIGIGSATPSTVITNVDLEQVVETSDEWIRTRTGIAERRVLLQGETLRDLQLKAAQRAIEMAGIDPTEIDLVICATSSPEDMFGDAPWVAAELGCTKDTVAFDLTAACSGFLFATVTASKFLSSPNSVSKKSLVIGADALSRFVDWNDRNSCILFGDGAGAMVLESSQDSGILGYSAHSNGKCYEELKCSYRGAARLVSTPGEGTIVSQAEYNQLMMNGKEVYKFATREVPKVLEEALDVAGMTVGEVDWLLLHQANIRIMEVVASRLGIPMEKVITNLSSYGNTSAASIPLALDEAVRSGKVKKGDVIACAGFGAGLSWGAAIFKWGKFVPIHDT